MAQPIELIVNSDAVKANLATIEEDIEGALTARTQKLNHLFAERVRQNLSGDVLQRRSGKLYDTVLEQGPALAGSEIVASVQGGGDEAPYGIVHEEGGQSDYMIYPVNARALNFRIGGKEIFAASVHHPPLPKRSWFGSVEEEMTALWGGELQDAIGEVL